MAIEDGYDVVIVGGGPVGSGLAIELGQRGINCLLVERSREPARIPKGQNLTQRTMEHLHFWGAEAGVRAARTIPREFGIGGLTAYGTLLGSYHYDWLQRELVKPFYFRDNERLPQYATEAVLRRRVREMEPVSTLYGWTAERLDQDEEGVHLEIYNRENKGRRSVTGRYLVGCDGSRSIVREQAGIGQTRSDHDRLMVLLVFRSTQLHDLLERFPGKSYFCVLHPELQGYWRFFGRVDLGTTWFFHAPVPPGTTIDNFDFRALLNQAAGATFDVEFEHIGFWDLRFAVADTYRSGRIFIAGDAAHSHPPYGGYGINTGFEDAKNLGWKLAARLQGWGGPKLLDTYSEERQPVFASTAKDFIEAAIRTDREFLAAVDPQKDRRAFEAEWAARQSGARTEVNAFEPNYEGSSIVMCGHSGAPSAVGAHRFKARPGHHLAPQQLSCGRNVFEALGSGYNLIDLGDGTAREQFEAAAGARGVPLTCISDTPADGRERYEAEVILVRPDQFVAWTGHAVAFNADQILRTVTAAT